MSRLAEARLTLDEVMACSSQARAIVTVCRHCADNMPASAYDVAQISDAIEDALALALDLMGIVHDAVEKHHGEGKS
jgi:hypothetical protein